VAFPSLSRRLRAGRGATPRVLGHRWQEQQAGHLALKLPAWLLNRLALPPLAADLSPGPWLMEPSLRALLDTADVIIAEHPWLFRPVFQCAGVRQARWVLDAHNIEHPLYAARPGGALQRAAGRRLQALEAFAFHHADLGLVVCDDDAAEARRRYGVSADALLIAPNGVDCTTLRPVDAATRQARKRALGLGDGPMALFVGAAWPPNVEAAREIVGWADALAATGVRCVIAGTVGRGLRREALPQNLLVTGPVDDVGPWLEAADLALNPMRSGGGSNIKLLEYLACGLPAVSTPFGARGLGLTPGRHLVIAPPEAFAREVRALLADRQRMAELGRAGRTHVAERFDWGGIARQIDTALRRLAARRRHA